MGRKRQQEGIHVATLEKRGDGFRLIFYYQGQRFQHSLKTTKSREADQLRIVLERNLDLLEQGSLHAPEKVDLPVFLLSAGRVAALPKAERPVTLGEFFKQFHQNRPAGKETATIYTEDIHIKRLLAVLGDRTRLADVPSQLQDYVNTRGKNDGLRGKKVSHVTIKKELATLSSIWNRWGMRKELVSFSLSLKNLEYPKRKDPPPFQTWEQIERRIARGKLSKEEQEELWDALYLTVPEIEKLLAYVRKPKLPWKNSAFPWVYPMVVFAAHTGARRSEIMRSRVEDIDFDSAEVLIREKKKDRSKTETTRRVPLTPLLREALTGWLKLNPGRPYTFCKTAGEQLTAQMMHHYLRWTLDKSDWKVIRGWHTLRHSFVSNLASKGISERIIMELAGHLNPDTTRRYAHLIPSTVTDAMEVVFGNRAIAGT
jgi:integrase